MEPTLKFLNFSPNTALRVYLYSLLLSLQSSLLNITGVTLKLWTVFSALHLKRGSQVAFIKLISFKLKGPLLQITVTMCVTPCPSRLLMSVAASMLPINKRSSTSSILDLFLEQELGRISRMPDEWRKCGALKNYIHIVWIAQRKLFSGEWCPSSIFVCSRLSHNCFGSSFQIK